MSSLGDELEDINEERDRQKVADMLGVSSAFLSEMVYEWGPDESNDGGEIRTFIQFAWDTPVHKLEKIKGIDEHRTVYFPVGTFVDEFEDKRDEPEEE